LPACNVLKLAGGLWRNRGAFEVVKRPYEDERMLLPKSDVMVPLKLPDWVILTAR
jgi:hypothetical protein